MDATFWALVSLIIFFAIIVYYGAPAMVAKNLDSRAERIGNELDEARRLREEAQQLLAEYQRKRKEAEEEADDIIAAAKREAGTIVAEAKEKTRDYVARRTAIAEQKIERAEVEAVNEVRSAAVDLAVAAAERIVAEKMDQKATAGLFDKSLEALRTRLN